MKEHYGTYPTYNEIVEDYKEIVDIMKSAKTYDDLLEIQKKHGVTIEINSLFLEEFDRQYFPEEVDFVRVNEYGCLTYIYFYPLTTPFNVEQCDISFDVWSNILEDEFLTNVKRDERTEVAFDYLTEQLYWEARYPGRNVLLVDPNEARKIQNLLEMEMEEVYAKYGYKRNECITYTSKFTNNVEMEISLCFADEGNPYTQAVLYKNGQEISRSDCEDTFFGEWRLEDHTRNDYTISFVTIVRPAETEYTWRDLVCVDGEYAVEEFPITGMMDTQEHYQIDDFLEAVASKYEVITDEIQTYMMDGVLPEGWKGIETLGCYINGDRE